MTKVFISQPMKGLTNEVIEAERKRVEKIIIDNYPDAVILDSFFKDAPVDAKPLWYLSKSIEILSQADVAYFINGWEKARGCCIENKCAYEYGISTIEE